MANKKENPAVLIIGIIFVTALMVGCIAVFTMKLRAHTEMGLALAILAGIGIYAALGGIGFGIGKTISSTDDFVGNLLFNLTPIAAAIIALIAL